jgi:hypothetical protein
MTYCRLPAQVLSNAVTGRIQVDKDFQSEDVQHRGPTLAGERAREGNVSEEWEGKG